MSEGHLYLAGGIVVLAGLAALALGEPTWLVGLLGLGGVAAGAAGLWIRKRGTGSVRVEIEDDHIHPIPVLDAPKGTFDLIAGLSVRVDNQKDEPVGVRIDTLLYRRTPWKWDRPVSDAAAVPLLASSVVPARSDKSFFARNYTRIPAAVDELDTRYFVKLLVATSDSRKSVHRVFLRERFELPKKSPEPVRRPPVAFPDPAPLLPFSERLERDVPKAPRRPPGARLGAALRRLIPGGARRGRLAEIHRLGKSDDSFEGLIDELGAELDDDPRSG